MLRAPLMKVARLEGVFGRDRVFEQMAGVFHMTGHDVNDTSFAFDHAFELQ
jgi:hypothetical protein